MDWNESKAYIVPLQFPVIACIKYDILSLRKQSSDKKKNIGKVVVCKQEWSVWPFGEEFI